MDQICIKRTFLVEKDKSVNHHWIMHFLISLGTKFWLKLKILIFWTKFTQIGHSWSKKAKLNITTEFYIFTVLNFGTKFAQKRYFRSKTKKSDYHRCILHIWISLGTKFQLKLAILIFWTKFAQKNVSSWKQKKWASPLHSAYSKYCEHQFSLHTMINFGTKFAQQEYFRSKMKKVNITSNSTYSQFWILGLNLPENGILGQKRKKWTSPLYFAYLN